MVELGVFRATVVGQEWDYREEALLTRAINAVADRPFTPILLLLLHPAQTENWQALRPPE